MKILVEDMKERQMLVLLCDSALKHSGVGVVEAAWKLLSSIEGEDKEKVSVQT